MHAHNNTGIGLRLAKRHQNAHARGTRHGHFIGNSIGKGSLKRHRKNDIYILHCLQR